MCCSSIARPATYRSPTQVSVSSPDSARHLLRSPTSRTNWANSLPSSPERCGSTRMQRLRSRCWHRWCSNSWRRFLTCRRNRQRAPTRRHRRKRVRLRHPFQRDYLGGHGGNSGRADAAAYRRRRTVVCCRPSPIAIAGPAEGASVHPASYAGRRPVPLGVRKARRGARRRHDWRPRARQFKAHSGGGSPRLRPGLSDEVDGLRRS